jgi:hypothetical protein
LISNETVPSFVVTLAAGPLAASSAPLAIVSPT